jgi:hypothetical protein
VESPAAFVTRRRFHGATFGLESLSWRDDRQTYSLPSVKATDHVGRVAQSQILQR